MSRYYVLALATLTALVAGCGDSGKVSTPKVTGGKAMPAELEQTQSAGPAGGNGNSTPAPRDGKGAR